MRCAWSLLDGWMIPKNWQRKHHGLLAVSQEAFFLAGALKMENRILSSVLAFSRLLKIRYDFVIGRAGRKRGFSLAFEAGDCVHLLGFHYLKDRRDSSSRTHIFNELLSVPERRAYFASSSFWDQTLTERLRCVEYLEPLLDSHALIFRYCERSLPFRSQINAEFLLDFVHPVEGIRDLNEIYLFLDKRDSNKERFCRSIFARSGDRDYTKGQTKWTLLFERKADLASGHTSILYQRPSYELEEADFRGVTPPA